MAFQRRLSGGHVAFVFDIGLGCFDGKNRHALCPVGCAKRMCLRTEGRDVDRAFCEAIASCHDIMPGHQADRCYPRRRCCPKRQARPVLLPQKHLLSAWAPVWSSGRGRNLVRRENSDRHPCVSPAELPASEMVWGWAPAKAQGQEKGRIAPARISLRVFVPARSRRFPASLFALLPARCKKTEESALPAPEKAKSIVS